jgi:hypothetical protein
MKKSYIGYLEDKVVELMLKVRQWRVQTTVIKERGRL